MPLTLTLLGTGTSAGVPVIGCDCDVCTSSDPHDWRTRSAAMVCWSDAQSSDRRILIDTGPDLRTQMLRHKVNRIDGVVYTHNHADHVFGLDDLRRFNAVMQEPIDIHAEANVIAWLRHTFAYVFEPHKNINKSFVAQLIPHVWEAGEPQTLCGLEWLPLRLLHGRLPILGYRIGGAAYCTDCSAIPPETYPLLEGLDVLVIDALRYRHHPTHLTIDQALEIIEQVEPRRAYLTHLGHEVSHADLQAKLPPNVFVGYDGLEIEVDV
jgi:phosphoribosyl 1,2-cyclic phosphate phosphodiesterase